jgi:Arc/MetJ-type ribon-helix-helix transcriptional regulator
MLNELSPDNELFLNQAVANGAFATREEALNQAVQALREKSAEAGAGNRRRMSTEESIRDLQEWSARHRPVHTFVDVSRESIY